MKHAFTFLPLNTVFLGVAQTIFHVTSYSGEEAHVKHIRHMWSTPSLQWSLVLAFAHVTSTFPISCNLKKSALIQPEQFLSHQEKI